MSVRAPPTTLDWHATFVPATRLLPRAHTRGSCHEECGASSGGSVMAELLSAENTTFVLLSFEGPDPYARAGGLGVRVTELAHSLAEAGYQTHLFFVGDPQRP